MTVFFYPKSVILNLEISPRIVYANSAKILNLSASLFQLLLPLFWFTGGGLAEFADPSTGSWTIPVMVVFGIIEIYLYFELVRLGGAVTVSQSNYVSVVMGVVWGMVIFGEPLMALLWAAVALLFISLFLTTRRR